MNTYREVICSQQCHCLSCPLSSVIHGKDCRELSEPEIRAIISEYRKQEAEGKGLQKSY